MDAWDPGCGCYLKVYKGDTFPSSSAPSPLIFTTHLTLPYKSTLWVSSTTIIQLYRLTLRYDLKLRVCDFIGDPSEV